MDLLGVEVVVRVVEHLTGRGGALPFARANLATEGSPNPVSRGAGGHYKRPHQGEPPEIRRTLKEVRDCLDRRLGARRFEIDAAKIRG